MSEKLPETSCDHAARCAGCPLIDAPYAEQLAMKRASVAAAFEPYAGCTANVEPTLAAVPREGYRVRAKLMVSADERGIDGLVPIIGLYERAPVHRAAHADGRDHVVVDIPRCRVLAPRIAVVVTKLRELLGRPDSDTGVCLVPEKMGGALSAIDLRDVSGVTASGASAHEADATTASRPGVLVTLVLRDTARPSENELRAAGRAVRALDPDVLGVAVNYRPAGATQVLGNQTRVLAGAEHARDTIGTAHHIASYGSFVQAHRGQAERIQHVIAEGLATAGIGRDASVLDLYGGSGALSLPFARRGTRVTLIEAFAPATQAAARAAEEQGAARFAVHKGDAARALTDLVRDGARFDVVLTNPPRRGMAPEARRATAHLRPRAIAYVSCDPETLARDLSHFSYLGYRAQTLQPVDMIPLTEHVETVAILTPSPAPPPLVHHEDELLRVVEKSAHITSRAAPKDERHIWTSPDGSSGLSVIAKVADSKNWAFRAVYVAVVRGIAGRRGPCGKGASFERTAKLNGHSLLQITLESGHKSELMRDLARSGHPVIGDRVAGHFATNRHFEERYTLDRPFLHCAELQVTFDAVRLPLRVHSNLPGELATVLKRLGHLASMSPNE